MEEAIEKLNRIIASSWKDINEECMKPMPVSRDFLLPIVNIARLVEVTYIHGDGYTFPEQFKDAITNLFINKIHI